MTPERWRQVKAILSAAMDRPLVERAEYLRDACDGDEALRREVDSLLDAAVREGEAEPHEVEDFAFGLVAAAAAAAFPQARRQSSQLLDDLRQVLGSDYQLDQELGGGGMARVFLGVEVALNRAVVVKVLNPEQAHGESAQRFAREVRFAARLQQANIVPVLRVGAVGDLAFYIMPYHGKTLRERIAGPRPTTSEALDLLKNIAKALACAHSEGVVHRDIKPENILLSGGTPVVADFGIAKTISGLRRQSVPNDESLDGTTASGVTVGTPAYMAPEQVAGETDIGPPVDVYAFGIVAYELLSGAHPFGHKHGAAALMAAQVVEEPPSLSQHRSDVAPALIDLVMRCLRKNPALRPQHGTELLTLLNAIESGSLGAPPPDDDQFAIAASIAVLPFVSLPADADNDFFSDGIADEVLTALTRMRGLRVAARTSAFAFKGTSTSPRAIARDLGVDNLLEGTVRRSGDRVRIGVRLLSAVDGLHLWSEQYDRKLADIFAVQEDLAQAIASALEQKLVRGRQSRSIAPASRPRQRIVDSDAFELYLCGRSLLEQRSEGMLQGLQYLEKASRLAPDFSGAHAAISMAYTLFGIYTRLRPREAFPAARAAAERALAIDPEDVLAIVMRAHTALWHEWDFQAAEELVRRALTLAPSFYLAHECLGYVLAAQGRFDESIDAMEVGRSLDPISENATYDLAWVLLLAGRWEQAVRELEPALAKHPRMSELRRVYGFCLFYAGRKEAARDEFRRVLELNVGDRWGGLNLVQALAALEEFDEARQLVTELEERATTEPIPPWGIAVMHHWLGNDDAALAWLEKSIDARDYWLVMAPYDPSLIRLRDHPRFVQAMRRVHASTPMA